jgi:lipopolysaccharide/colanic/teichoic acid biosynthesis glycosyltransferase
MRGADATAQGREGRLAEETWIPSDADLERRGRYKRAYDLLILAGAHLFPPLTLLWLVLWMVIPLLIRLEDRGPVFYGQERLGKNGKIFYVLKFRTMVPNAEQMTGAVWATADDPRITKVGRWLRSSALDELPQVLNILKGDMSFVGPRAERPELHAQFVETEPLFAQRVRVRPGLTGLAQVKGSYDLPPERKVQYDLQYMRTMGPVTDTRLMLSSVLNTLLRRWDHKEHG